MLTCECHKGWPRTIDLIQHIFQPKYILFPLSLSAGYISLYTSGSPGYEAPVVLISCIPPLNTSFSVNIVVNMTQRARYLVLGGGISGLSAAYRLLQKVSNPSYITVVESASRLGGWIQSKRYDDGVFFELGPRGLRPAGPSGWSSLDLVSCFSPLVYWST